MNCIYTIIVAGKKKLQMIIIQRRFNNLHNFIVKYIIGILKTPTIIMGKNVKSFQATLNYFSNLRTLYQTCKQGRFTVRL